MQLGLSPAGGLLLVGMEDALVEISHMLLAVRVLVVGIELYTATHRNQAGQGDEMGSRDTVFGAKDFR